MKIRIVLKTDGSYNVIAEGYQGPSCRNATRSFLEALGGNQESEELLPEYYQAEAAAQYRLEGGHK